MTSLEFRKKVLPHLLKIGIGLGIGLLMIVLTQPYFFTIPFLQDIEHLASDMRFEWRYHNSEQKDIGATGDVVIVGISDKDLESMPDKFPFPRHYYAQLIENLNRSGARAIGIDITFETPGRGDDTLRQVLNKYRNVVLAAKTSIGGTGGDQYQEKRINYDYGNVFFNVIKRFGIVNVIKDRDDVVRRYVPMFDVYGNLTPSLAVATVNAADGRPPRELAGIAEDSFVLQSKLGQRFIPKADASSFYINYYGPVNTIRYVDFTQAIDTEEFQTKEEMEFGEELNLFDENTASIFRNKIVLVGSTMAEERDYHKTPIANPADPALRTDMHGVEIHATVIQNLLNGDHLSAVDLNLESLFILFLAVITFYGVLALRSVKASMVWLVEIAAAGAVIALIGVIIFVSLLVFTNSNLILGMVNPSLAIVFSYVGTIVFTYLSERQQKALIKGVFSHYVSPSVVNELISNPEKARLGGDKRELTVFFSDVVSFTTISEQLTPEELVELLNEYLDEMTEIIIKYNGTLDKYEGDAIMAFWGAPIPQKEHALRACLTALDMQDRLRQLRIRWKKEKRPALEVRIGINTGPMIAGNMGGKKRFDYTVIGDSVNLASRLEGANKQYHSSIMISEFTYTHVKNKLLVRELDLIQVKGKNEPVRVYELLGTLQKELSEEQRQSMEMYSEGLQLYRQRKWDESIAYMQQAASLDPECYPAQIYIQRSGLYKLNPPPSDWNGVFIMTTK